MRLIGAYQSLVGQKGIFSECEGDCEPLQVTTNGLRIPSVGKMDHEHLRMSALPPSDQALCRIAAADSSAGRCPADMQGRAQPIQPVVLGFLAQDAG